MKKLAITVTAAFLLIANTVNAEIGIGVTANFASIDTSGSETLRDSGKVTTASRSQDEVLPELFIEARGDRGAFGLAYIPVQELGSGTRADSNNSPGGDTGQYTATAEVKKHMMLYTDINLTEFSGQNLFVTGGISSATISTGETLNGGSAYEDEDVLGYTIGAGVTGDMPFTANSYYKLAYTYTDYDGYEDSNSNNKIKADTEVDSIKASIGYKF